MTVPEFPESERGQCLETAVPPFSVTTISKLSKGRELPVERDEINSAVQCSQPAFKQPSMYRYSSIFDAVARGRRRLLAFEKNRGAILAKQRVRG